MTILKNHVIGVFKIRNRFSLVMNYQETNKTVDLFTITAFGAVIKEFNIPIDFGQLILFPENKNMNDMLIDPFEWSEFIKSFN